MSSTAGHAEVEDVIGVLGLDQEGKRAGDCGVGDSEGLGLSEQVDYCCWLGGEGLGIREEDGR